MAVAARSNGLHHAVSLGTIEVASQPACTGQYDRSYDSEDENMSRRRLRHTSSTELYPRTSVYSKGDIREQYCLTDRQLNSIERPRRERLFGCLSRRSTPQSFLGVCVGRRVPSDENLAAYAPFYKYPRYHPQNQYGHEDKAFDADMESSYFRRQPASILSTGKATDTATTTNNRYSWMGPQTNTNLNENLLNYAANGKRTMTWLAATPNLQQTFYQDIFLTNCLELCTQAQTPLQSQTQNLNLNMNLNQYQYQYHPQTQNLNNLNRGTDLYACSYHCPPTQAGLPASTANNYNTNTAPHLGVTTPRTKHVSFARSHTLTSFDDVNLGLRSSGRLKTARSQERLIGGKKPALPGVPTAVYDTTTQLPPNVPTPQSYIGLTPLTPITPVAIHTQPHPAVLHTHPHIHQPPVPPHTHQHGHGHSHQHLHGPIHIHQFVPTYNTELAAQVQTEQPVSLLTTSTLLDDMSNAVGMGVMMCPTQTLAPPSPEIVVVEKKFRNAMKTQATQTELRKDGYTNILALSPRTLHKVKVVSQGAQTNGMQNGKKLTKSLSEMPNGKAISPDSRCLERKDQRDFAEHDALYRTQSEEPPRSPLDGLQARLDAQNNINYYEPPPPVEAITYVPMHVPTQRRSTRSMAGPAAQFYQHTSVPDMGMELPRPMERSSNQDSDERYSGSSFDYESNSLPRRACSYHRTENEFHSNSLPRRDLLHGHEICKHITECSELMNDSPTLDFTRPHLLPPPQQYCRDDDEDEDDDGDGDGDIDVDGNDNDEPETPTLAHMQLEPPKEHTDINRRRSMVVMLEPDTDSPFRRDDIRRQSMPIYVKTEKLIDGYAPRSSFRSKPKPKPLGRDFSEEKEIFIDFKPRISPKPSPKTRQQKQEAYDADIPSDTPAEQILIHTHDPENDEDDEEDECDSCASGDAAGAGSGECSEEGDDNEDDYEGDDPLYENVPPCVCKVSDERVPEIDKREQFRKRSVSLDEIGLDESEPKKGVSSPPSPCREELLANASTYPSSDSLANDITRDHSDGIWNESQVTVLTAEQRDISDGSFSSNLLLTPSSKRKNLILQHQQRSSIDTDALELEEQFTDHSPTYNNVSLGKQYKPLLSPLAPLAGSQVLSKEQKTTLTVPTKIIAPSIAVTPTQGDSKEIQYTSPKKSPCASRRSSKTYTQSPGEQIKNVDAAISLGRSDAAKFNVNTDISECSTNTDEYATCTDTSKRTPGIKTPPTTTSSSSTTQVPVSTQSSQMDKSHGGSSFESASSLYSTRGETLCDEMLQLDEKPLRKPIEKDSKLSSHVPTVAELAKKSPSHSISSTSSGSYNIAGLVVTSPMKDVDKAIAHTQSTMTTSPIATATSHSQHREKVKIKPESVSDDERSEMRYSSSGYYESPHDEDQVTKFRRHRIDEDRKRRKTSMKLDIEKENMRALTSPVKKPSSSATVITKERSPEKQTTLNTAEITSPNKIKRFRPKIRRQFRKISRDESTPRRQRNITNIYGLTATGSTEKLLDCSIAPKPEDRTDVITVEPKPKTASSPGVVKSISEASSCQLKAKSIESLRSVSPGSDSVFYSEADGTAGDQQGHCLHCGKEMEGQGSIVSVGGGDSVESLPFIENEQDIVKPPSDFADSPVTTKTTQRLYKKMDKRFRSEERYHGERGRLYKSRQENIRAKSEERSRDSSARSNQTLRPAGSSPCVLPDASSEQSQHIIYRGHYDSGRYTRLTDADVWTQLDHQSFDRHRDRRSSTESERSFHSKYQVILHRLVQRRCTLEMYHRQNSNTFQLIASSTAPDSVRRKLQEVLKLMLLVWAREGYVLSRITAGKIGVDKTIVVKSDSGEFGFRIHGSKPVVVAAIEPETPAESSGLEVGDIIIAVNGVQVLDKHHTEVVKIAHDGCEKLELQVARTIGVLMHEQQEPPRQPIYSGYLWRQSGQAKGTPNTKKWVRRWFSLRPDNCLYYYKTEDDTQPVGAMIMAKHTIEHCPPEIGKPYAFKVDSGEGIPMYVAADSEELTNRWITVLKQSASHESSWLDKCARNLYQQPSSITKPDCFGYLMKLGSRWCGWSKRYCVLKDACLYFYQDANSKSAFGMACLHGYKVASMSTNASGKKNSFEIIPPETKLRHYYFCTDTEMDKKRWISALEYSIDRWIKSG